MLLATHLLVQLQNESDLSSGGGDSTYVATWAHPGRANNKQSHAYMEREKCVCRVEASRGCHGNQLQTFPAALIIRWLTKPSGEALSLYLWKPSKWAHYDKSRSKKWLHTFSTHHHIHFLSLLLPKGEENETTFASREMAGGH